jgi:hypothetical protein
MDAKNLGELYDLPIGSWTRIEARLATGVTEAPDTGGPNRHTCWLATIDPDGAPHVTGIGALWVDGAFWFVTGESSRKGRNLARDQRCTLSLSTQEFDLTIEGTAPRITDPAVVARMAERYADDGWPATADESGTHLTAPYSAPSAGGPPWALYRITPRSAMALEIEPSAATRWTF